MNPHEPAFPRLESSHVPEPDFPDRREYDSSQGISRLEYFAGHSLTGIKANDPLLRLIASKAQEEGGKMAELIAQMAFADAEAMCAEAEKRRSAK